MVHEKSLWALIVLGAVIALGKLLTSNEVITARLALGRIILGSATSLVAGMLLIQLPNVSPLAMIATGSALGIAGAQVVEAAAKRWGGTGQAPPGAPKP
ncbi:MAG: phage holin family protein [Salinisphaera sp.]|nr:phage holin family protein [Salinisphaera sp.]